MYKRQGCTLVCIFLTLGFKLSLFFLLYASIDMLLSSSELAMVLLKISCSSFDDSILFISSLLMSLLSANAVYENSVKTKVSNKAIFFKINPFFLIN